MPKHPNDAALRKAIAALNRAKLTDDQAFAAVRDLLMVEAIGTADVTQTLVKQMKLAPEAAYDFRLSSHNMVMQTAAAATRRFRPARPAVASRLERFMSALYWRRTAELLGGPAPGAAGHA